MYHYSGDMDYLMAIIAEMRLAVSYMKYPSSKNNKETMSKRHHVDVKKLVIYTATSIPSI